MLKTRNLNRLLLTLFVLQAMVNLIGALGPELGFDALWYHLTEAKLFWARGSLNPIPGNLLYWSGLPRLGEVIYALALRLGDERLAKIIHWGFGLVSAQVIYLWAKERLNRTAALASSLLWYTTLLVGWLSTTSYVDLLMTAFLLLAFKARTKLGQGVNLALAGAVKLQAVAYNLIITLVPWSVLGLLPFALINYRATGNPVYPFLEHFGFESEWWFNGFAYWLSRPVRLFFDPVYRVGPVILILFFLSFKLKKRLPVTKLALWALLIWALGPGTDFGRFALFPLALMALAAAPLFKKAKPLVLTLLLVQAVLGIGGRAYANKKYLPVIFGSQTKSEFLATHLKFHFGDWYDVDNWFSTHLKPDDKVLVYAVHNLYYLDFPFDHRSWADLNQKYTYIMVGDNQPLPDKYANLPLVYENVLTRTKVYENRKVN